MFDVPANKVLFMVPFADEAEIDLKSGFLMLPQAIPQAPQAVSPTTTLPHGLPAGIDHSLEASANRPDAVSVS
jgi:hypothetical protein